MWARWCVYVRRVKARAGVAVFPYLCSQLHRLAIVIPARGMVDLWGAWNQKKKKKNPKKKKSRGHDVGPSQRHGVTAESKEEGGGGGSNGSGNEGREVARRE